MITAEYISHMGTDLTVVNSARVSFDKESDWGTITNFGEADETRALSQPDTKLINYLANHKHLTPFTHPQITLRETVPIFVARQRFKHVVGFTYNEVSRRYVDAPPEFYVPEEWRSRPEKSVKQGSGSDVINFITVDGIQDAPQKFYKEFLEYAAVLYTEMIADSIAPEQARMVLPQSMLTSYYVTGSLAAFARAYNLRVESHAQKEIQDLAEQWSNIISPLYPVSWSALTQGNY